MRHLYPALLLTTVGLLAPAAHADLIQIVASGPIFSSNMAVFPAGQLATVTLTYDSSTPPQSIINQQSFTVNAITSLRVQSGAYDSAVNTGNFGVIGINNGFANVDSISFVTYRQAGNYTFTTGANTATLASVFSNGATQTFEGVRVNFNGDNPNILNSFNLPTSINAANFTGGNNIVVSFSDGGFQVGNFSAVSVNLSQAPEPASLGLLVAAVPGLLRRRRMRSL